MNDYIKFINRLFESREQAHVFHLQTKNHAEHLALQDYYENIVDLVDGLVEAWQGKYLEILEGYDIIYPDKKTDRSDPLTYFISLSKWIDENKTKCINESDSFLLNIVDEISVLIYKTIYKLKFLK